MARGSIIKRKSATTGKVSYQIRVELPADPLTGKRRQGSETFRTREAAEKRLTAWQNEIDQGSVVAPDKITVGILLTDWLDKVARHKVRPTSMQGYRFTIERYLIPRLGTVPVQKLMPAHLQTFTSEMLSEGRGARTVQLCHLRLSQALELGMQMGYVNRNICTAVERPNPKKRKPTIWTPEEANRFLEEAGDWRPVFELMISTGIRRGEALGLRWEDFDAGTQTLTIARTLVLLEGAGLSFQDAKTETSHRRIILSREDVDLLKRHRTQQYAERLRLGPIWKEQGLIFPNDFGGPLYPDNLRRAFHRIIKSSGVPRIRIHDLRHTNASWMLLNGVPLQVASERLGHSRPSTTSDLYAHTLANSQDIAVDVIEALMAKNRGAKRDA